MNDALESVILVTGGDQQVGTAGKLSVHRDGQLHRAFSIFLFDNNGRTLIQKRADVKYHSAGLWANTCCGHPRPGEPVKEAANRRLMEELGMSANLKEGFQTVYEADLGQGMKEHEYVHVYFGLANSHPQPEPTEVSDCHYLDLFTLQSHPSDRPQTVWLRHYLENHFRDLVEMRDACLSTVPREGAKSSLPA